MPNEIPPPASAEATVNVSIEPPAAKAGRAIIDAIGDALQNLAALLIIAYAWLEKGAIDKTEAAAAAGVVLGFWSVASVIDRFTSKRTPRAPLTVLVGAFLGSSKGGAAAVAAGEVARRTLLSLVLGVGLMGCAWWNATGKPVARTLNDIAREYCERSMAEEAERQGISPRDLCILPWVFAPFLEAPRAALDAARAEKPAGEP